MKNRIVYPQLWLDEKYAQCSVGTKLLFMYLITNIQLGLSRYLHITDRQIMFDTGLSANQLETGKKELTNIKWMFFTDNWVFHNHKCSYVDYEGQQKVIIAKEKEIAFVPLKVREYFKGLTSGKEGVLNPSIIKNQKPEIINQEGVVRGRLQLSTEQLQEISGKYHVPVSFVLSKQEDVNNWVDEKPARARGRDLRKTLVVWVKKDAINLTERSIDVNRKRGIDATQIQ